MSHRDQAEVRLTVHRLGEDRRLVQDASRHAAEANNHNQDLTARLERIHNALGSLLGEITEAREAAVHLATTSIMTAAATHQITDALEQRQQTLRNVDGRNRQAEHPGHSGLVRSYENLAASISAAGYAGLRYNGISGVAGDIRLDLEQMAQRLELERMVISDLRYSSTQMQPENDMSRTSLATAVPSGIEAACQELTQTAPLYA